MGTPIDAIQHEETAASVGRKTAKSTVWTYLSYFLGKGVNLLTTAILARLLSEAEFGIVGFALTAMSFLDAVRDLGLDAALIQRRDQIEEAAHTAYWMGLASNTLIWLITIPLAPLVADFFREPQITIILPVLSFSFVISGFGNVHDALLKRDMKFARRIFPSLGEAGLKSLISVGMALAGAGVWSLVIGQLAGRFAFTVIARRLVAWKPQRHYSRQIGGQMFRYGYKISIDSLLSALQANIDYVFIGRFLGDAALGLYTIAYRLPEMIIINLCIVIAQVLLPAYSKLQHDMDQLRQSLLQTLRYISIVTVPIGVGMALIAAPTMRVLFSEKWGAAGPTMSVLCLYGAVLAISWNIGDVYKAIGRPDILWKTTLVEFSLLAPTLYFLAQHSTFAVSLGHLSVAVVVSALRIGIAMRTLNLSLRTILSQFATSAVGSLLMAVPVIFIISAQLPDLATVALAALIGAVTYTVALFWLERDLVMEVFGMITSFRRQEERA